MERLRERVIYCYLFFLEVPVFINLNLISMYLQIQSYYGIKLHYVSFGELQ